MKTSDNPRLMGEAISHLTMLIRHVERIDGSMTLQAERKVRGAISDAKKAARLCGITVHGVVYSVPVGTPVSSARSCLIRIAKILIHAARNEKDRRKARVYRTAARDLSKSLSALVSMCSRTSVDHRQTSVAFA